MRRCGSGGGTGPSGKGEGRRHVAVGEAGGRGYVFILAGCIRRLLFGEVSCIVGSAAGADSRGSARGAWRAGRGCSNRMGEVSMEKGEDIGEEYIRKSSPSPDDDIVIVDDDRRDDL
jgi:hypothetical protein